jgi:DNA-binding LacI/PurR family transcriptional regulator
LTAAHWPDDVRQTVEVDVEGKKSRNGGARAADPAAPARRKRATIRDVAAAAGVSPMTVSNVINGKLRFVSEDTRRRVLKEMELLDYRLLSSGRNLRLGNRQAVGVVIVDESPNFLSHPFISRMVSGLCGALNLNGYAMMVQGIRPEAFANTFAMRRADADGYCIRLHGSNEVRAEMLQVLDRLDEPVVLVQETLPVSREDRCVVRQDDYGGSRMIADHLAARGVQRLVVVVPRFSGPMTDARLKGLRDGFRATRRNIAIELVTCDYNTYEHAYAALDGSFASSGLPDAVVGINDELAMAALRVLQDHQTPVPDKVIVAGFNGFNPPGYTRPDLTTVVSCPTELGASAASSLLGYLEGGRFEQQEIVLPVHFRMGQST